MVQQVASLERPIDNKQQRMETEEEIDLRQYIAVLIKYWYWIVGLAIVAALVAFAVSSFLPSTYQATALVTANQPRYQLQFDPRFQNIPEWNIQTLLQSQYRTYPALATSDDLLQQVAEKTGWSLNNLRGAAQATVGSDPSLLTLTVRGENAQDLAKVVNAWAEIFVLTANRLYGGEGELERFKQQRENVAQSLAEANAALTAFREENGYGFVSISNNSNNSFTQFGLTGQRLQARNELLTNYETELVRLHQIHGEIALLAASTPAITSPVLIAGLLSEMINTGVIEKGQLYQINLEEVDPVTGLAAMDKALAAQAAAIEAEVAPLRAEITGLQAELAAKQAQLEELIRQQDILAETYATLSRKVQEAQLEASGLGQVKVASQAAVPTVSVSPRRTFNAAVAGVLGLIVGIFGAFAAEWWRNGK